VPWTSPDYYPLWILSELLGGAFDSRLNQNLRETNAYSYSSTTSLGTFRGTAPFEVMGLATPENTADAMREMKTEVERVRTEALARDEIERVKRAAIRRIPMMFSTLAATLQSVETLAAYDRPANDYSTLASAIERVSVADVERVARVYLAPDQLRWFVVADASMVRKSIEATSAPLQVVVAETPKTRNVPSAETRSPPK
jgi:zinc protease